MGTRYLQGRSPMQSQNSIPEGQWGQGRITSDASYLDHDQPTTR